MSGRAVFSVATGPFVRGQERLRAALHRFGGFGEQFISWTDKLPPGSPPHDKAREPHVIAGTATHRVEPNPYAFKAFALQTALAHHARPTTLLWCDSCIVPVKSLERVWETIEREGYFFIRNGFSNYEWTADSAYPALFPELATQEGPMTFEAAREVNKSIEHVVAGCFGISLDHAIGREFLTQYKHLAEQGAFKGPWVGGIGVQHRHDQTCASVIAWRLGMKLTKAPDIFAYANKDGSVHESTILVADGGFVHGG